MKIDFGNDESSLETGYFGYFAEHENNNSFLAQSYTISNAQITLEVSWPDGTKNTGKQMIDRGKESSGPDLPDILRDWIGTDGRSDKVPFTLKISGLPDGLYKWRSYHHDNKDQTGVFNVKVTDAGGSKTKDVVDISNGSLALKDVTIYETELKSNGSDILLRFEMNSYPNNSTSFFVMNGFELSALNTNTLPEKVTLLQPLNNLKFASTTPTLKWTDSNNAESYNLYLGTGISPEFYSSVEESSFKVSSLEANTTYYWSVESVNKNGAVMSEVSRFTTDGDNYEDFSEEMELTFSHSRNLYDKKFFLKINSNNPNSNILYTIDCSEPSLSNGIIYDSELQIDSTTLIKALAVSKNGKSKMYTHSYIFPSAAAMQTNNPAGFPNTWGGAKIIDADYEMDKEVTDDPEYSSGIVSAFHSLPSLSLSMDVEDWFNHSTGMYVGYPNSNVTREKAVTAEFLFNDMQDNFAVECGVQNQGGTSIVKWKIPKQSMRILFKEDYGPTRLRYKLFPDSDINSINTLVVDGMLYSWLHPWDDKQRLTSLYFRDQLASDLQNEMGRLSFHGIYVNLFINGLYWGIYDLHERPDDAFLSEYLDAEREDFDIIKHNPNRVVSGSNVSYKHLLDMARQGLASEYNFKAIQHYLDLPAFIDYMILNFYLGNYDWAHQNYYAAVNRTEQTGFSFYTWDAEHVMRYSDVYYNNTLKNNEGGPTEIHTFLKENREYRMMFADAVYKHLYNDGALTPKNFEKKFLYRKEEIEEAIILESARWGDYRESESGITYTKNEYWIPEVNKVITDYIPKRRDIVISQLRDVKNRLFPRVMPPTIEVEKNNNSIIKVKFANPNSGVGNIYYTLDGRDPRQYGGTILGSVYKEPLEIIKSAHIKARYRSSVDGEWSALAQEIVLTDQIVGENIVINEIMYHPPDDHPEFIELVNNGELAVNLQGYSFTNGIDYTFSKSFSLFPNTGIVLTNDTALFEDVYNFRAYDKYQKKLSNNGETIILENYFGQVIDSVTYSDTIPWPELADGDGYSLELKNADLDNALYTSWQKSDNLSGSPFIPEIKKEIDAELFPNPFYSDVYIRLNNQNLAFSKFNVEIYNLQGTKVKFFEIEAYNSIIRLKTDGLPPGVYIVKLSVWEPNTDSQLETISLKAVKINY